tara:strand:+ start:908 stop:1468 length:561 start_codon:yes stop_codon:yes gene_type:complete
MAIVEKTFYTPYVTVYSGDDPAAVSGVIVDSIQVVSDDLSEEIEMDVTPLGAGSITVEVSAGDTLSGPFTAYNIDDLSGVPNMSVIVHERSKTIFSNTMVWSGAVTSDGGGAGSNDTVQLVLPSGAICTTDTADVTIDVTTTDGTQTPGTTISGSDIISVTTGGLITVTAALLGTTFTGTIYFKTI